MLFCNIRNIRKEKVGEQGVSHELSLERDVSISSRNPNLRRLDCPLHKKKTTLCSPNYRPDPAYCVLICRECQYAIQKSAVSSHLLRHKIYREERQRFLSHVANLELLEPEDVSLPPPWSAPIEGLPVIAGVGCTQDGCGSLCASLKRMKKHQSEVHGVSNLGNVEEFARPAALQTFFRGTKLRYFEVTAASIENPTESSQSVFKC